MKINANDFPEVQSPFSSFLWSTYVYDNSAALCFNIIHYHPLTCFKISIGFNSWSLPPRDTLRVDIGFLMNHSTETLQRISTYLDSVYEKPRDLHLREGLLTNIWTWESFTFAIPFCCVVTWTGNGHSNYAISYPSFLFHPDTEKQNCNKRQKACLIKKR